MERLTAGTVPGVKSLAHGRIVVHQRLYLAAMCLMAAVITARAAAEMSSGSVEASSRAAPAQAAPAQPQAGYAGSDTCVLCHSDKGDSLKGTPHAQAKNPRSPAATQGCESCHGPGQAHVDDDAKGNIRRFGQIKPDETNQTCLTCHNRGNHAGWEGSGHERRNLSCSTCHSVHSPTVARTSAGQGDRDPDVRHVPSRCRWPRPSAPWRTCRCARARCRAAPAITRTARSATSRI